MLEFSVPKNVPDWVANHTSDYLESGGTSGHMWAPANRDVAPLTTLLLVTKSRKTGKASTLPLIYLEVDGSYVVVASKGGAPEHPSWYLNLVADPKVALMVATDQFEATARTATGDERASLWPRMVAHYAPYQEYADKATADTGREVPIVVLERA